MPQSISMAVDTTAHPPLIERDAARYVGLSIATLRMYRRLGRGPAYLRLGRAIRYPLVDLNAWLNARRVETCESRTPQEAA